MIQIVKDREILKRGENGKKEEETRRETSRVSPKLEPETKKRTTPTYAPGSVDSWIRTMISSNLLAIKRGK